jgi:hypothetical protein
VDISRTRVDVQASPASLAVSSSLVATGEVVSFDASGSAIADSEITRFDWDLDGDGHFETDSGTSPTVSRAYSERGTVPVRVRATRTGGRVDEASASVEVRLASPGEPGVSINGGDIATNDRDVELSLAWPRLADAIVISNDGGFGPSGSTTTLAVGRVQPWQLASSGAERLPKIVYVRYRGGSAGDHVFTDDIILDESVPAVQEATIAGGGGAGAARAAAARFRLRVRAKDDNAGLVNVELSSRPGRAGTILAVKRTKKLRRDFKLRSLKVRGGKARYLRVEDAAGNFSRWRKIATPR